MTTFLELVKKANEIRNQLRDEGKKLILEEVTSMMEKYPEVMALSFYQYTPGFNDGDPCYNSLVGPGLLFASDFAPATDRTSVTLSEYRDARDNFDECGHQPHDLDRDRPGLVELADWLSNMTSEQVLEQVYGTNKEVVFLRTAEGIKCTEKYYDCGH